MAKYSVYATVYTQYIIEASSKEEAEQKILDGIQDETVLECSSDISYEIKEIK